MTQNNNSPLTELVTKARTHYFTKPLLDDYSIECVSEKQLWEFFDPSWLYQPKDLYLEPKKLLSQEQRDKLARLSQANTILQDSVLIKDLATDTPILLFHGYQKSFDSYYMQFTAVHPDYRQRGIYSAFLERIIGYTAALGLSTVVSCHSPVNNPVLIAKLKKNFKITALEIDGHMGINVWLTYFHNKELESAFEFRCGHLNFSQAMVQASYGTTEQFYKLLQTVINK